MRRMLIAFLCVLSFTGVVTAVRAAKESRPAKYSLRIQGFDPKLQTGKNPRGQMIDNSLVIEAHKAFHTLSGGELLPKTDHDPFQFGMFVDGVTATHGDTIWIDLKVTSTGRFNHDSQPDVQIVDGETLRFRCPLKLNETRTIRRAGGRRLEVTISPSEF